MPEGKPAHEDPDLEKGRELRALIVAWHLGISHRTALDKYCSPDPNVDREWGRIANQLHRLGVESVDGVLGAEQPPRLRIVQDPENP